MSSSTPLPTLIPYGSGCANGREESNLQVYTRRKKQSDQTQNSHVNIQESSLDPALEVGYTYSSPGSLMFDKPIFLRKGVLDHVVNILCLILYLIMLCYLLFVVSLFLGLLSLSPTMHLKPSHNLDERLSWRKK